MPSSPSRTRVRRFSRADALCVPDPQLGTGAPEWVVDHDGQAAAFYRIATTRMAVTRSRHMWVPVREIGSHNAVEIELVAVARGVCVDVARTVVHHARSHAMMHAKEWVCAHLPGSEWVKRASVARWRDDQEPLLWCLWLEGFSDVEHGDGVWFLWRNPAF